MYDEETLLNEARRNENLRLTIICYLFRRRWKRETCGILSAFLNVMGRRSVGQQSKAGGLPPEGAERARVGDVLVSDGSSGGRSFRGWADGLAAVSLHRPAGHPGRSRATGPGRCVLRPGQTGPELGG